MSVSGRVLRPTTEVEKPRYLPSLETWKIGHGHTFNPGLGNQTQPPGILNLELVRQSSSNSEEFIPVAEETATAGFAGSWGSWARESGEGLPCPMLVG